MSDEIRQSGLSCSTAPDESLNWKGVLRVWVWMVPAIGIVVGALLVAVQHAHLADAWRKLFASIVYTMFIGIPCSMVMNWIGFRFSERFPRGVTALHAATLLVLATVGTLAGAALLVLAGVSSHYGSEFWSSYPISVVITLVIGLATASFETMRHKLQAAVLELRTQQVEQERANKLLVEAQLSSLESRIHPHFLFNTLNSIASLIPSDPKKAEDTVGKLASLLRFSLNANHTSLVPLAQEMKMVRDYLEIESTRFGSRLRYEIAVPESLAQVRVPPLALQCLAENSVKHVVAQRPEGASIRIVCLRANESVQLAVIDNGPGFSLASVSPDHGLGNLSARLQLLFNDAGRLDVTRETDQTVARITIPATT